MASMRPAVGPCAADQGTSATRPASSSVTTGETGKSARTRGGSVGMARTPRKEACQYRLSPAPEGVGVQSCEVAQVVQLLAECQLAPAAPPVFEVDRHLLDPATAALHEELQADLEADGIEARARSKAVAAQ